MTVLSGPILVTDASDRPLATAVAPGTIHLAKDSGAFSSSDGAVWSTNSTLSSGVKGATGSAGATGPTGATGIAGDTGITGYPGNGEFSPSIWKQRSMASSRAWRSVCYGNGIFVAVADSGGSTRAASSPDCSNWTEHSTPGGFSTSWKSVCYGNGIFVAVASDNTDRVMTSVDGNVWTARTAAEANYWTSVCYGNGMFVAVALGGTHRVMTSLDGITWTARTAGEANQWSSVCYGNGMFVAVSSTGTNRVMISSDGISWTAYSAVENAGWSGVAYGKGLFVAVNNSAATYAVMTSPDGINWTGQTSTLGAWSGVCYGDGYFITMRNNAGVDDVMLSTDGSNWSTYSTSMNASWLSCAFGNGMFVIISLQIVGTSGNLRSIVIPNQFEISDVFNVLSGGGGNLSVPGIIDIASNIVIPSSGDSLVIPDKCWHYIVAPAALIATLTLTLPANPVDGQIVTVCADNFGVTTLTVLANVGQILVGTTSGLTPGSPGYTFIWVARYTSPSARWYRV